MFAGTIRANKGIRAKAVWPMFNKQYLLQMFRQGWFNLECILQPSMSFFCFGYSPFWNRSEESIDCEHYTLPLVCWSQMICFTVYLSQCPIPHSRRSCWCAMHCSLDMWAGTSSINAYCGVAWVAACPFNVELPGCSCITHSMPPAVLSMNVENKPADVFSSAMSFHWTGVGNPVRNLRRQSMKIHRIVWRRWSIRRLRKRLKYQTGRSFSPHDMPIMATL